MMRRHPWTLAYGLVVAVLMVAAETAAHLL